MSDQLVGSALAKTIGIASIASVLIGGAWIMAGSSVSDETNLVSTILVPETRSSIRNDNSTVNATTANLIAQKRIPDSNINGATIVGKFGAIAVAPANILGTANDGFTYTYGNVFATKQCNDFAQNMASFTNTITVNGTSVKANGVSINTTTLSTQCATSPAAIVLGFSKSGN